MKKLITDLGVVLRSEELISLYYNNNRMIVYVKEPKSHQKSKDILRRFHIIREIVTRGDVVVERILSEDNIIDPLTKLLSQIVFEHYRGLIGIKHRDDWL